MGVVSGSHSQQVRTQLVKATLQLVIIQGVAGGPGNVLCLVETGSHTGT